MKKWLLPALALALIGTSAPALATTILFAGSEDSGFTCNGTCGAATSSPQYRTSFARAGYGVQNSTTVADPPANRITTPTFTSGSTVWVHAEFFSSGNSTTSGEQALILRSPDGVARILLRQTGTAGTLKASTRNAAGTITDLATATGTYSANTVTSLDLGVNYGCTSGDTLQLYLAGVQIINYTGNLCTDSATQLSQLDLAAVGNNGSSCFGGNGGGCWSEVIVANGDTRGMALYTLAPAAAGNTQSWTPNTVGDINPTQINDSNFVAASSSNSLSQWTTPTSLPSGTWNVLAVVQEARVSVGTTGPQHFEWLLRTTGGSNYVTGSLAPLQGAFSNFSGQIWATNPSTSSAWSTTDIGSGFNLGVESLN